MKKLIIASIVFLPTMAFAAPGSFKELVDKLLLPMIDQGTKILISIAVLIFFWNVANNLWGEKSAEKNKKMRDSIMWGVLIIFVMVSIWGIIYILRATLMRGL